MFELFRNVRFALETNVLTSSIKSDPMEQLKVIHEKVFHFFGGTYTDETDAKLEKIMDSRGEGKLFKLGDFKGAGCCRHRAIAMKLLIDELSQVQWQVKLIIGYYNPPGTDGDGGYHAWNVVDAIGRMGAEMPASQVCR